MIRNPLEAYAFWSVSKESLDKIKKSLDVTNEQVSYKLFIKFQDKTSEEMQERIIDLPPKTDNWIVRFEVPPINLKMELVVYTQSGESMVLFHSATVIAPEPTSSEEIHNEWKSADWNIPSDNQDESTHSESNTPGESPKEGTSESEKYNPYNPQNFPGSSGNFLGASNNSPGSSYNPYKR